MVVTVAGRIACHTGGGRVRLLRRTGMVVTGSAARHACFEGETVHVGMRLAAILTGLAVRDGA